MDLLLLIIYIAILVLIAVILVRKYRYTKDIGLIVLLLAFVVWPLSKEGFELIYDSQLLLVFAGKDTIFPFSLIQLNGPWEGLNLSPGTFKVYYYLVIHFFEVSLYLCAAFLIYHKVRSQHVASPDPKGFTSPGDR